MIGSMTGADIWKRFSSFLKWGVPAYTVPGGMKFRADDSVLILKSDVFIKGSATEELVQTTADDDVLILKEPATTGGDPSDSNLI